MTTPLLDKMRNSSPMFFADYMQMALYDPDYGYYSSGLSKIGKQGDFITAPELTPLFGHTLANQCAEILQSLDEGSILEFGAGTGQLCIDVLTRLESLNCLPQHYFILEVSGYLKQCQQQAIMTKIPHLAEKVRWLDSWPKTPLQGVMLANEVLDAMPVHRFLLQYDKVYESLVEVTSENQLQENFIHCTSQKLLHYLEHCQIPAHPEYYSEANLFLEGWIKQCFHHLEKGCIILIDYGFPRHEYYHPDRHQGTLMCHYHHRAHTNPFLNPGEQDITAHVDFTHVAEAGRASGFHVAGFTNQASFLLGNGLLSLLQEIQDEEVYIKASQPVKQLVQPSEMGELFKVIALTKDWENPLSGFMLQDKRVSL